MIEKSTTFISEVHSVLFFKDGKFRHGSRTKSTAVKIITYLMRGWKGFCDFKDEGPLNISKNVQRTNSEAIPIN
jgi:hypothetical protein